MFARRLSLGMLLLALASLLAGQSLAWDEAADIDKLIGQLGADDDAKRQDAEKKLKEIGEQAVPALKKAAKDHADPDVRLRAGLLLREMEAGLSKAVRVLKGHTETVWDVAVSRDDKRAVTVSEDKTARLWDLEKGEELRVWKLHSIVRSVALTPDGKQALVGGAGVFLLDLEADRPLKEARAPGMLFERAAVSPDGELALLGDRRGFVELWDLKGLKRVRQFKGHTDGVRGAAFVDKDTILTASTDKTMRLWDGAGKEVHRFEGGAEIDGLALSPDRKRVLISDRRGIVRLVDLRGEKELLVYKGHTRPVAAIAFLADGRRFVTGGHDKTVRLYDVDMGKELRRYEGHTDAVWKVAVTADGRFAVSSGQDKTVRVWRLPK